MEFSPLTPEKLKELLPYFAYAPANTCDYTPGGLAIWQKYFKTEYCLEEDALYLRFQDERGAAFDLFPMAKDPKKALLRLPRPLKLCAVPKEALPLISELFPKAEILLQEKYADYLYDGEEMRSLIGKKFSTQRNHINRFQREYPQWSFAPITRENSAKIRAAYLRYLEKYPPEGEEALAERDAILSLLESEDFWQMEGGALFVAGEAVGFSFGEVIGETLHVHIEKADRDFKGAYQMLTNQYANAFGKDALFINREDDMGDEGLKKAKLAYHPITLLEKFLISI